MNIGIIASSGGSVFKEVFSICRELLRPDNFFIITDRVCGIEDFCRDNNIPWKRIECKDNHEFSFKAKEQFESFGTIDFIVLFFLRLISEQIYKTFPTFNIHPSILPAFQGFNPLKKAFLKKVRFIGATLHMVDNTIDDGRIVGQIINPISPNMSETQLNTLSFLQKVYLFLLLIELNEKKLIQYGSINSDIFFNSELPARINANPCITSSQFNRAFMNLQYREGFEVIR